MNNNILCHIVGLNPKNKLELLRDIDQKQINIIDLEQLNKEVINNDEMLKYFKQYNGFKNQKNDKYKDVEKKMIEYWRKNMTQQIDDNICGKKKSIIIGYNTYFKNMSKKVNINTNNKFLIKSNKYDIRTIIENNINNHKSDIIKGIYPLENIDFNTICRNKNKLEEVYLKEGYLTKDFKDIVTILDLLNNKKIKHEGLWISMKQPYNIKSKIYPKKNDKIFAYTEPIHALLGSFTWNDTELIKSYKGNDIKLVQKKADCLNKLKQKRYLYFVEPDTFIPHEKGNNIKFFSQAPVIIKDKEEIINVYDKFQKLGIF
jgi:hypothetical protein